MTEVIFVLVVIYAAYVIHTAINHKQLNSSDQEPIAAPPPPPHRPKAALVEDKPNNPTKKPIGQTTAKDNPFAKSATPSINKLTGTVRHPETGEVVKIPVNNYRMTKRWIKEALVEEGLLDKVYKVNELDEQLKIKINQALIQLQKMEKYQ